MAKSLIEIGAPPKHVMGLDVTESRMKLVVFRASGNTVVLEKAVRVDVPEDATEGTSFKDIPALSKALKSLISTHKIKYKKVAAAVLPSSVMTKVLALDDELDEEAIEQQISVDADKHVPYSLDEVRLDFQVLGKTADKKNKQDVLLVATHSEPVDQYVELISGAGLKADVIDVYQFALLRACEMLKLHVDFEFKTELCVAFIEVSLNVTRIVIIHNGEALYTDEQTFSESISSTSELEDSMPWYRRSFQIFSANHDGVDLDVVIVHGDRAGMEDLNDELALYLNKKVLTADPFCGVKIKKGERFDESYRYLIASGLALREEVK